MSARVRVIPGEAPKGFRVGQDGETFARVRDIARGLGPAPNEDEARQLARLLVRLNDRTQPEEQTCRPPTD